MGGAPRHVTIVTPPPSLEAQLQHASQIHRVRISELLHDYDPLRSGYITCELHTHSDIPYSQIFSREKNFANFTQLHENIIGGRCIIVSAT